MSWIGVAHQVTYNTGRCTRCGAERADGWARCPLDGICPAPDYSTRFAAAGGRYTERGRAILPRRSAAGQSPSSSVVDGSTLNPKDFPDGH